MAHLQNRIRERKRERSSSPWVDAQGLPQNLTRTEKVFLDMAQLQDLDIGCRKSSVSTVQPRASYMELFLGRRPECSCGSHTPSRGVLSPATSVCRGRACNNSSKHHNANHSSKTRLCDYVLLTKPLKHDQQCGSLHRCGDKHRDNRTQRMTRTGCRSLPGRIRVVVVKVDKGASWLGEGCPTHRSGPTGIETKGKTYPRNCGSVVDK